MAVYDNTQVRFGSVSMVTLTPGVNDPEVGTICRDGDEEYVFVYNNGNSQISKGFGAVVTAVSGYSVTVSSVAGEDQAVGLCVHNTMTTSTYGWLLKKGFCNFKAAPDSTVTAGGRLAIGDNGVWFQPSVSSNISNTLNGAQGKTMVGTASAGTAVGYFAIY